jgi:hypothetical protein
MSNKKPMKYSPIYIAQPFYFPLRTSVPISNRSGTAKFSPTAGLCTSSWRWRCASIWVSSTLPFANETLALVTALQALRIIGEVITTPYSFVASAHSLLWHRIKPVFVDIDRQSLNLNLAKIEAKITPQTTAILPVHCYGNPCDLEAI